MGENRFVIYAHPVIPELYPDYTRSCAKAVTRGDLGDRIQFMTLRVFTMRDNQLVNFKEDLDLYTEEFKLGKVIWPLYRTIFMDNFRELVDEAAKRGLYLFDFWGYVPGSFPDKTIWGEFEPPQDRAYYLRERLGNRFLGFDNGEQDGRYIGGYAPALCSLSQDRRQQYLNFHAHFEKLGNAMQNQTVVLNSLNFTHYFAREGNAIMLGAETAQALINTNLWYAYIRGAGKQYGLLWYGNASVWNRWGYKSYESEGAESYFKWGAEQGSSLSLLRRLMYTEYAYNSEMLGFEQSWIQGDNTEKRMEGKPVLHELDPSTRVLTPVGEIQAEAVKFVEEHGRPGVLHTPVAILLDFFNGWVPPRHLYTNNVCKVWGNLPYKQGDFQLHALFSMLYPGYEDSGFYENEKGFLAPTPYGDIADVIFNDADGAILDMYRVLLVSGEMNLDLETYTKLVRFAEKGGHVIITAEKIEEAAKELVKYTGSLLKSFGIAELNGRSGIRAGSVVELGPEQFEEDAFELCLSVPDKTAELVAIEKTWRLPVITSKRTGSGRISVIYAPFGLARTSIPEAPADNRVNKSLPLYYDLLKSVKQFIGKSLEEVQLISLNNPRLQYCTNSKANNVFLVSVSNNGNTCEYFSFIARTGDILSVEELAIAGIPEGTRGYYPAKGAGVDRSALRQPAEGEWIISPGDIRIFKLVLGECDLESKDMQVPSGRHEELYLSLRDVRSIKEFVLTHPAFSRHFNGIKVDAAYIEDRSTAAIRKEAEYLLRQKVDVIVDFSSMLNHYPGLSLINNIPARHGESMDRIKAILDKAVFYGCKKAVLGVHRNAEGNFTIEEGLEGFARSLNDICDYARERGISTYLQNGKKLEAGGLMENTDMLAEFLKTRCPGVKFAFNVCHSLSSKETPEDTARKYKEAISAILLSAPLKDIFGQTYDVHQPFAASDSEERIFNAARILYEGAKPDFVCLDASYSGWNEVYRDLSAFGDGKII